MQVNGVPKKAPTQKAPVKKPASVAANKSYAAAKKPSPVKKKAASVAGEQPATGGVTSAYAIMASRIANRVAEMAEQITFVEKYAPTNGFPSSACKIANLEEPQTKANGASKCWS